ncbi:unnamed protein product [Auanema sp. JU1783]|nr:unnamed protein product [Auanema sp. JU1783]
MTSLIQDITEGDCWLIHPRAGYVIKFKEAQVIELDGPQMRKCFVNLCHSVEVPSPIEDLDQDTLAQRIDQGDFSYRVPISIGEIGHVTDNKNESCMKIDVLINTIFFEKRLDIPKSDFFRHFITLVLCDAIEQKHSIKLDANDAIILTNRKKMGELDVMKLLKKPDNNFIATINENNIEEPYEDPRWDGITVKILKNCKIEIKLSLSNIEPPVDNPARLRLQIGSNRVVVLLDNHRSLYDFCIPFVMDYNVARSKLSTNKQSLFISTDVIVPS